MFNHFLAIKSETYLCDVGYFVNLKSFQMLSIRFQVEMIKAEGSAISCCAISRRAKYFQHYRARADFDQNTPGIPFLLSVQPSMKFIYRYLWEFLGGIIIILKACSISCSYQPVLGPFWMPTNSLWRLNVVRRTPSIVTK